MVKSSITIQIDSKVMSALEKRAKKEMLEIPELISEILRRSVISYKGNLSNTDNIDDKFLSYFSRKQKVDYLKGFKSRKKPNKPLYGRVLK